MKAVIWTKYGPPEVLQPGEVEKPIPRDNEVLVRIYASTVTAGDCELRSLRLPLYFSLPIRAWLGFTRPRSPTIPGNELAGEIEAVGKDVRRFKAGDQVFGTSGLGLGAYAEYKCLPEAPEAGVLVMKPPQMTYEEAAAVPVGGLEALHFLRQANIQDGQKVLVNGAGGSIGTFAVQLARYWGAEVTGVDRAEKLDMLRSIGVGRVIDYTTTDFTQGGEAYDVIFDVAGKSSFSRSLRVLKPGGRYLLANPGLSQMGRAPWASLSGGKKVILGTANYQGEDLIFLTELIAAGKIKVVLDRCYPLEQVAEAHRYVEQGHKKGGVIITVGHSC